MKLSIIIPAYNEAMRMGVTLRVVVAYLDSTGLDGEVIVVDDGSRDDTSRVVLDYQHEESRVALITLDENCGKGAAVRKGILSATGDVVMFMDADLSTPIEETSKALELLEDGADIVIGTRAHEKSEIELPQGKIRRNLGKTFNALMRKLIDLEYADTQCGFKVFRGEAAQAIAEKMQIQGFAFDVEMLVWAKRLDYHIRELPVRWINEPDSRVHVIRHSFEMLRDVVKLRTRIAGNAE